MKNLISDKLNDCIKAYDVLTLSERMLREDKEWEKAREENDIKNQIKELEEDDCLCCGSLPGCEMRPEQCPMHRLYKAPEEKKKGKYIIAGSRTIDTKAHYDILCAFIKEKNLTDSISEVVCGMARGVDELGYRWAKDNNKLIKELPALWDKHGKSAGFKRNEEMAEYADGLILIWDGQSKGALDMFTRALDHEIEVHYLNLAEKKEEDVICALPWAKEGNPQVICDCTKKRTKKELEENICTACGLIIDPRKEIEESGAELVAGSFICPTCGRELTEEEVNNICTECGATLNKATATEELINGVLEIRHHISNEETQDRIGFIPTCEVCGEEMRGKACTCGEHTGNIIPKEKRPELKDTEINIPSDLYIHAKDCKCKNCTLIKMQEINTIERFGCKNPL